MNDQTLAALVEEFRAALLGHAPGKVFQFSRTELAIDFRTGDGRYLFLSVEPAQPRAYLIARRVRDLEKSSLPPSSFLQSLRKHLSGTRLRSLEKDAADRILRFEFTGEDELGNDQRAALIAQLTGRSANLLLLSATGHVIETLRPPRGPGQQIGDLYQPPPSTGLEPKAQAGAVFEQGAHHSLSEALDRHYQTLQAELDFKTRATAARQRVAKEIVQQEKLRQRLLADLAGHGSAEEHKRIGDLLLANLANAQRAGATVRISDFYAEGAPIIEIKVDENSSLQDEAARRFALYGKAKRAAAEIKVRLEKLEKELDRLQIKLSIIENIIETGNREALDEFEPNRKTDTNRAGRKPAKAPETIPGVRRYRSSDGYEVLVGRGARDNDFLTFKVARPHDLWLHAANYPGSHVVVRNASRKDVPQRTIQEAAQLAAYFSHAREDAKVDVHYTQRKFISKPKGAAPGLVRLSSFRTLITAPGEPIPRI